MALPEAIVQRNEVALKKRQAQVPGAINKPGDSPRPLSFSGRGHQQLFRIVRWPQAIAPA